jgi:hypothetical protein
MSQFSCGPRYYRKPIEWIFSITLQLPERRQRRLNGHDRAGKVKGSMLEVDNLWDVSKKRQVSMRVTEDL